MLLYYRGKICSELLSLFCIIQWSLPSRQFIFNRLLQQIKYVELVALPRKIPNGQFAFWLRAPLTLPKKRSRKPRLAAAVRASRDLSAPLATLTLTTRGDDGSLIGSSCSPSSPLSLLPTVWPAKTDVGQWQVKHRHKIDKLQTANSFYCVADDVCLEFMTACL